MRSVRKYPKEKLLILSFIALLALGFFISVFNDARRPSTAQVANPVTATFTPATGTFAANANQIIDVTFQTDAATKKISGLDITFNTTGSVNIVSIGAPVPIGGGTVNVNKFIENITPTQGRISYAFISGDADLPPAVRVPVTIKGTANGAGTLTLNQTSSQIVGNISNNVYGWGTVSTGNYTIGTGGGTVVPSTSVTPTGIPSGPTIKVRLNPATNQKNINEAFNIDMIIDGQQAGQRVSGLDIKLKVNPAIVRINSVSDPIDASTGADGSKFTMLKKEFNAATGEITLNYVMILAENLLPTSPKFTIGLTGLADGTTQLEVLSSQVTGNITQNAYVVIPENAAITIGQGGPTPTTGGPTPTTGGPTPTIPTGSVTMNLKVKFQGVLRQPNATANSMKVQVMVGKDGFMSQPSVGTFTADANGVWSGTVAFNDVQPGAGYRIYVKGGKHLQKKICADSPTETAPGTYRCASGTITVNTGANSYDFSGVYMLVGDLPEQGTAQNGVVDSFDTSYIKLNFGSTTSTVLAIADLNLDGIVDTQDYALVIASLSIKYDEL